MSGAGDATPEQRLERVRGSLMGASKDPRAARWATQGHANVLIGASLHAADRLRRGQTVTELEQRLLDVLGAVLPEREIKDWGGVYREAVQALGSQVAVVPPVISRLSQTTGFRLDDFKDVLPALGQEHAARSNTSVVSRETLAAGGSADSDSFVRGLADFGFGATVVQPSAAAAAAVAGTEGEEKQAAAAPAAAAVWMKLELESFRCVRAVGDQWGGRDEIYWTSSVASDKQAGPGFISQEFGKMKTGESGTFNDAHRTIFEGFASEGLVLTMSSWEADQSPPDWAKALQEVLVKFSEYVFSHWGWALAGMLPGGGYTQMVTGILAEIASMFAWVAVHARNDDDVSCTRMIIMNQYDLALLAHRKTIDWQFNGDGHHALRVRYTGDLVPFPTGTLEYAVRTGDSWSAPLALPWESNTPPALASYNGKLYAAFVDRGQQVLWTRLENGEWKAPKQLGGDASYHAPALCAAHGKLFYAVTGTDGGLYWRSFTDSGGWTDHTKLNAGSSYAPSMAAHPGWLWLTHIGADGTVWHHTLNSNGWRGGHRSNLDWAVDSPVAMATHENGGQVWRIARGTDNTLALSVSHGHDSWRDGPSSDGTRSWRITHGPALAAHGGKTWIFLRAMDGTLRAATYTEATNWSGLQHVGGQGAAKPMDEPAAASHDNKLYVMYRR